MFDNAMILEAVAKRFPEAEVKMEVIKKNNGVAKTAVLIRHEDEVITPSIYIDDVVEEAMDQTVEQIADRIAEVYVRATSQEIPGIGDVNALFSKEMILDRVQYQLIGAEANAEMLEDAPHKKYLDMAAVYRVVIGDNEAGRSSAMLKNGMFEMYDISIEELDKAARENTIKAGFKVRTMAAVMAEMSGMPEEMFGDNPMMVITNSATLNGAAAIMFDDVLKTVEAAFEGDFFVLPSSIHECLAVPAEISDVADLRAMVEDVNDTQVAYQEILTYNVYRYRAETGRLEIAE